MTDKLGEDENMFDTNINLSVRKTNKLVSTITISYVGGVLRIMNVF